MSLPVQLQLRAWRTRELRELLENEDKIENIISCSEKFQRLQQAAEKMMVSNQKLAKASLSQKPKLRDAKLLLALKYKELEKCRSLIQAKQEELAEKYSLDHALQSLQQKISSAEKENEPLFRRFAEGKISTDFVDSFLRARKLHHIRVVLVKKLQEVIRHEEEKTLSDFLPEQFLLGFPEQVRPACSLTAAVVLPACCHPPFLLPLATHAKAALCYQYSPFCSDHDEFLQSGLHRRGLRPPVRPVRLQPLKVQQRRHQQK